MRRSLALGLFAVLGALAPPAYADDGSPAPAASSDAQTVARAHFEQALALYRQGKYRGALAELEQALALDPSGKDLVYNLALVREKLEDYDGAIEALRRLATMEQDPHELQRIEQSILRLEGARDERRATQEPKAPMPEPVVAMPVAAPRCAARGRYDGWVLGAEIVSGAAALVGAVYGVRALMLDPSGESTGPGRSFAELRSRAERAHRAAIVADISFGVSLIAGASGVTLYLARSGPDDAPGARVSSARVGWAF